MEELRNNIRHEVSTVSWEGLQNVNTSVFCSALRTDGQEGRKVRVSYTAIALASFITYLKVILAAMACRRAKVTCTD